MQPTNGPWGGACVSAPLRAMGGGWWWARVARLARLRFRGSLLPPQRPRSGGARGSFAPGHGPRAGASPPPVSELDRADAWLLRKAHETGLWQGPGSAAMREGCAGGSGRRRCGMHLLGTGPGLGRGRFFMEAQGNAV